MKDLTRENIYKTFFLFGLPLALSGLLTQSFHIVDTMIAGKFLGDIGLAAMGAVAPFISFCSSLFWGFGCGCGIYFARLFGAGEYKHIKEGVYSVFALLLLACALMGICSVIFNKQIFDFLQIEETLRAEALRYFAVYMLGLFFIMSNTWGVYVTTGLGISNFPFYMSLISAVINVVGNIFCVAVLKIGVMGLAISTIVASMAVDVCYLFKLKKCFAEMNVHKEKVRVCIRAIKATFPYSIPNCLQQAVMYLSSMLLSPLVNGLGASASAAYAVVARVYDLNSAVYQNSARSLSNYSAQCIGHNERDKISKGVFVGLLQGIAFVLPFVLVCSIAHKPVCALFFKADADSLTKEYAYLFARRYLPFICMNLVCNLFHALFRGVKAMGYLFGSTFLAAAVRYISSALLIVPLGMEGFYLGWVISWGVEAVFVVLLFFFGRWNGPKKKQPKKAV
ncbi:MAG: hypothetical protein IJX88_05155 [Clostridia bacterium]|nr:hypothetical protein [Clostridia bacterium]